MSRALDTRRMQPPPLPLAFTIAPFSTGEALEQGLSVRRLRARDLRAPFRGVRASIDAPEELIDRCLAYLTRDAPIAWFSGPTAAQLWGIPLPARLQSTTPLHVTVPGKRAPRVRDVVGHTTHDAVPVSRHRALPVLAAADTWCELGALLTLDELIEAGDRLLGLPTPLASRDEIDAAVRRRRGKRGAAQLTPALIEMRPHSYSARETRTRLTVCRAGYPEPELNSRIALLDGTHTRGDLVFRAYRVLLEYDGEQHRDDDEQWAKDVARLNALAAAGWLVVRITKHWSPAQVLDALDTALRARGWRP